jgi:hypothetical protein
MGGVYFKPNSQDTQLMNFLNGEKGTGRDGNQYQISLGGDPRAEAYVRHMLTEVLPTGLERVHFLDRVHTLTTLSGYGGISCRVKSEG